MRAHSHRMMDGIRDLCHFLPSGAVVAEVGSYAGESAALLMESKRIATLHCIDPWLPEYYSGRQLISAEKQFDSVAAAHPRIVKHKAFSSEILTQFIADGVMLDMIYIDGNHSYEFVRADILLALQVVRPEGIIAGHDYKFHKSPGVERAVKELLGFPDVRFADYSWLKWRERVGMNDIP